MDIPKPAFDTWVRDAELVAFEDGSFIIGVQNAYARDWLDSRLKKTIARLLASPGLFVLIAQDGATWGVFALWTGLAMTDGLVLAQENKIMEDKREHILNEHFQRMRVNADIKVLRLPKE